MKKNIVLLLLAMVLALLAYVFIFQKDNSIEELNSTRNFRIENVDEIHRLFIAQKGHEPLDLTLSKGTWYLNGKYKANLSAVNGIKDFFINNRIKFIPSKAATENIINEIAKIGIKVEAFDANGKTIKSFFVGGNTPDERGTYFLMNNAEQPYVLELPAMVAVLRERFLRTFDEWRSNEIFAFGADQIEEISVSYPKDKNYSFRIKNNNSLAVEPYYPNAVTYFENPSKDLIDAYIADYNSLFAEGFENNHPEKDSIINLIPFVEIKVKTKNGELNEYDMFTYNDVFSPNERSTPIGLPTMNQVERLFLYDKEGEFYIVQMQLVKKLLRSYDYFFPGQIN